MWTRFLKAIGWLSEPIQEITVWVRCCFCYKRFQHEVQLPFDNYVVTHCAYCNKYIRVMPPKENLCTST